MENKITANNVSLFYGQKQALFDVNINFKEKSVTALIGPSGCGKSSFLRCLNRMNDTILNCKIEGDILLDGKNIYHDDLDVVLLRARVGMVFLQKCLTTESRSWVSRRANLCSHLSKIRLALLKLSGSFESVSQSVSQLFHGPAPRSPLHRLAVRLRHSRSNTSTEYSLPGATQLSQVRSISPSGQGVPCRFLPCTVRAGLC